VIFIKRHGLKAIYCTIHSFSSPLLEKLIHMLTFVHALRQSIEGYNTIMSPLEPRNFKESFNLTQEKQMKHSSIPTRPYNVKK
jgi:hypothetical protein